MANLQKIYGFKRGSPIETGSPNSTKIIEKINERDLLPFDAEN